MNQPRLQIWYLLAAVALFGFAPLGARADDELVYVKRDSKSETRAASLAASGYPEWPEVWHLIGPFDLPAEQGLAAAYPPETEPIDLKAKYPGKGEEARWRAARLSDGRVNSLKRFKQSDAAIIYLYRRIDSPKAESVRVSLGSDDGLAVWLNGEQLLFRDVKRGAAPGQDFVTLDLVEGQNDLLVKVSNHSDDWSLYFERIVPPMLLNKLARRLTDDFPTLPEGAHYRTYPIPLPEGEMIEVAGLAFRHDGALYVATRRGDVWLVENPTADDPTQVVWHLYARGLHEVLGLLADGDDLLLVQRPEVTRLRDTDRDGVADEFSTVCDDFGLSGHYHEYIYGPVREQKTGDLFVTLNADLGHGTLSPTAYRGSVVKIAPDGSAVPWATGLRSPNGVNFSPDGRLFYTDNQGEWIPVCKLTEVRQGEFYGHRPSLIWLPQDGKVGAANAAAHADTQTPTDAKDAQGDPVFAGPPAIPPAVWFPYAMCRSSSEPVWDTTDGRFGPFAGECLVGEYTNSLVLRVALEEVGGRMQGACFPFLRGFSSGVNRLIFAPDGTLVVGGTNRGWGTIGGRDQSLEFVKYTGKAPFEILAMHVQPTGFDLEFTKPVGADSAQEQKRYFLESYKYHYWSTYGSPEIDRREHEVTELRLSDDGRTVHLTADGMEADRVYHLRLSGINAADGSPLLHDDAYYTANALP